MPQLVDIEFLRGKKAMGRTEPPVERPVVENVALRGSVLIVSGDKRSTNQMAKGLGRKGFHVNIVESAAIARHTLAHSEFDALLVDLELSDMTGLMFCEQVVSNWADLPVIAIARTGTLETAVASIRAGAYDYLARPLRIDAVAFSVARAIQHRSLKREVRRLREAVREAQHFGDLLGSSSVMGDLYELLERVANSEATVMIAGETGTGKELAARAIHKLSRRRRGAFVPVN
ncbi:MAG: sigma-54-dependent Fis family transcriptional regulator, partial [Proteobacteria bacterium]|nr:sigma-54-dependent Fis family transcriptional regulator [Pseudomonadota bacterium]